MPIPTPPQGLSIPLTYNADDYAIDAIYADGGGQVFAQIRNGAAVQLFPGGGLAFPILAPDGSLAAPSYSFASNPGFGLSFVAGAVRLGSGAAGSQLALFGASGGTWFGFGGTLAMLQVAGQSVIVNAITNEVNLATTGGIFDLVGNGEWRIGVSLGTAGQVPKSAGPGFPVAWGNESIAIQTWGAESVGLAVDTRVMPPGYTDGVLNANTPKGYRAPRAGIFRNLTARHNTANGNGSSVTYTLRVNGALTALTVTLATGAIGSTIDSVNTVAVAAGDLVELVRIIPVAIGSAALDVICAAEFLGA